MFGRSGVAKSFTNSVANLHKATFQSLASICRTTSPLALYAISQTAYKRAIVKKEMMNGNEYGHLGQFIKSPLDGHHRETHIWFPRKRPETPDKGKFE